MTNEEILKEYTDMLEYYNGELPDPEHEPIQFASKLKMFRYYREKNADTP